MDKTRVVRVTRKSKKETAAEYNWIYNLQKNYGQLGTPTAADNAFQFKIKIEKAELMDMDMFYDDEKKWRIKIDSFGMPLKSRDFSLDSEGNYNVKRKQGILMNIRSDQEMLSQYLAAHTLPIRVECLLGQEVVSMGTVLAKLSVYVEMLTSEVKDKWRRVTRDVKVYSLTTDEITRVKLSLLLTLVNNGLFDSQIDEPPAILPITPASKMIPAEESISTVYNNRVMEISGITGRKSLLNTTAAGRPKRNLRKKNRRTSMIQLTNELDDKSREVQDLKESYEKEISELSSKYHNVCIELSELKLKLLTDENENKIEASQPRVDVGAQTDFDKVGAGDQQGRLGCQNNCVGKKLAIIETLEQENRAKRESLAMKEEALKLRESQKPSGFLRRGNREVIVKKQQLKQIIEKNNNIFEFIEAEIVDSLQTEILSLEADKVCMRDIMLQAKLESAISAKNQLLVKFQSMKSE